MRPLPCAILTALTLAPAAAADITRNLPQSYEDTRLAMENGAGSIVCIGDSLTQRQDALWQNLRALVQSRYGNGGVGYRGCSIWSGSSMGPPGAWVTGNINSDSGAPHAVDGLWAGAVGNTAAWLEVAPTDAILILHYAAHPGGGPFIARFPDGAFDRIQTYALSPEVRTLTVPIPPGFTGRVRFEPQAGAPVLFLGAEHRSQMLGPRIHRVANGGWGVTSFLARDWTFDSSLAHLTPSLILIMLGQNDAWETRATFGSKMAQLVTRVRAAAPQAEVVLISSYDANAWWNPTHAQAMEDVAISHNTGFINVFEAAGDHAFFEQSGYLHTDGVHWSPAGGAYVAQLVFDALESGGASLEACTDLDFNNDTLFPDSADIDDLLAVFAGAPCPAPQCDSLDFNRDGLFPDTLDIDDFLRVFAGGSCP